MGEEKIFCPLCGKYKTNEALKKIPISPPPPLSEKIEVEMCFDCDKVIFNLNRILTDRVKEMIAKIKEASEKMIVVPSMVPPSDMRHRR